MSDQKFMVDCGFFDAVNNDRLYSADQMNLPYKRIISNGIFANPDGTPSEDFAVVISSGMHINVKPGDGLFGGKWFISKNILDITVPTNSGGSTRVDSVIIQIDNTVSGRAGNIVYRTGGASAPDINTDANIVEYRVANLTIPPYVSAVTASMITDLRGRVGCPWIRSLVYQPDNAARIDEFISTYGVSNGTKIEETVLFTSSTPVQDSTAAGDGGVEIASDITSFDYVDIRYAAFGRTGIVRFKGSDIRTFDGDNDTGSHWSEFNRIGSRTDDATPLEKVDFLLEKIDATHIWWLSEGWAWSGKADETGKAVTLTAATGKPLGIYSITGVNYVAAGTVKDPELTDIRVGASAETYPTAGDAVRDQVESLQKNVGGVTGVTPIDGFQRGKYIQTNLNVGETVLVDSPQNSASFAYKIIDVSEGDKITLNGTGGNAGRLWAFVDSSNALLSNAAVNATASNLVLTAPANAVKLVLNMTAASIGANYIGTSVDSRIAENVDATLSVSGKAADAKAAGDEITDLKSAVSEKVESATVTPTINTTAIGLTVKAVNNTLEIYGTASANRRYCFLNGQNEFHTTGDELDKTLDSGVYNITITETGHKTNVPFNATYSTFGNGFALTSGVNNFTAPVMIGIFLANETNYGTSENPTVISFSAEKIIARDPIAREDIADAREDIAEVLSEIINLSEEVSVVPNSTDYNTLTTAGTYRVLNLSNANTMTNIPTGIGAHKLIVFKISDGQKIYQILLRSGSVKIYIRNKDGSSAWTDWVQIALSTDLMSLISTKYNYKSMALANGTDYDSVDAGSYYCSSMSSAQSMSNCPVTVGHRLFVFESYNASDFVQVVMANREFYFRYRGEEWKSYELYKPDVPTYYASHIANREEKANTIIADVGIHGDSFAAIADTHWGRNSQNSPDLIKHIALNTPINRLVMLGDYYITQSTEAGAYKALNTCLGAFKNKGMQLYIIPGNHDYNKGTISGYPVLTESQVYGQIMTGQYDVTCDDDTCSFWFDNKRKKIRYFFTTCMYDSSYNTDSYKWVFGEMENLPTGYSFIIFTHTGLSGSLSASHEYSQYLTGAMAAVRSKSTYTFDGEIFDYSNVNATPLFILAGHNHFDNVFTYDGIACIQITTDAYYYDEGGLTRTQGTVNEQAFDIVTIDLYDSVVYLTRVGAGHDRIVHYGMETVTTTKSLTATLTGTLTWATSNNSVATVSAGTVTKAGSGYCTITATDTNGLTEDWVVKC